MLGDLPSTNIIFLRSYDKQEFLATTFNHHELKYYDLDMKCLNIQKSCKSLNAIYILKEFHKHILRNTISICNDLLYKMLNLQWKNMNDCCQS